MQPYAELAKRFVPPSNEQFALFLPEEDVATAARGEIPQPKRWFYVQTTKSLIQPFVSAADFAQIKQAVKTQNDETMKKAESQMPGLLQKVNKGLSEDYKLDLNLSVDQMLPLPAHNETERSLAYSTLLKYKANDEGGKPFVFEGVVTATFVYLQGKILFLYANGEKSDLDWSRSESQKWANTVIAANPSTGEIAVRENKPSASGLDWNKVFAKTITGAAIGGIIGAVGYIFRKKKS
jgi:hypothetical protein